MPPPRTDPAIAIDALRGVMDALRRDHESVLCEYRERSYTVGRRVCVHDPKGEYGALAVGIGDDYSLTVRTDGGEVSRIFTGDVSVSV